MNHQDVTVSNMVWCPALIMVHQISDNGAPTVAFVDPQYIRMIRIGLTKVPSPEKDPSDSAWVDCTVIHLAQGDSICVTEAPEVIARLRDEAFGHNTAHRTLTAVPEK